MLQKTNYSARIVVSFVANRRIEDDGDLSRDCLFIAKDFKDCIYSFDKRYLPGEVIRVQLDKAFKRHGVGYFNFHTELIFCNGDVRIPCKCEDVTKFDKVVFDREDFSKPNAITVTYSNWYNGFNFNFNMPVYEEVPDNNEEVPISKREEILRKAIDTVCHDRQDQYGKPEYSAGTIAMLWSAYLQGKGKNCCVDAVDVNLMMALLKIGREIHGHKDDNMVDLAGYASLAAECYSKSEEGRIETLYSEEGEENGGLED